jgi:valyl-tRNA synthetase
VLEDPEAERLIGAVQAMITTVRNARAERGFTPKDRFKLYVNASDEREGTFFAAYSYLLNDLARLDATVINEPIPEAAHHDVVSGFAIGIEFPEKVVTKEQIDRTQREIEKSRKELAGLDAKLENEQFVNNAPAAVVEQARARQEELRARLEKLAKNQ